MRFLGKRAKKQQKRAKYLKIWEKCTKFESSLKKDGLIRATIESMKQLEYALTLITNNTTNYNIIIIIIIIIIIF